MREQEFPVEGELIVGTVTAIKPFGAFIKLEEYVGKEGLIHISEISSTWVRNIRNFVREGQKVVARVLRVDPEKGHIDLSLKRITDHLKQEKMREWKQEKKAEKLLELTAKKLGKDLATAYEEVGYTLQEKHGTLYTALEETAVSGSETLKKSGIPKEWVKPLTTVAQENIEIPTVEIKGYVDIHCPGPTAVQTIKKALITARDQNKKDDVDLTIQYVGAPRYRIKVEAPDYKLAEKALRKTAETAINMVKEAGGQGEFRREIEEK